MVAKIRRVYGCRRNERPGYRFVAQSRIFAKVLEYEKRYPVVKPATRLGPQGKFPWSQGPVERCRVCAAAVKILPVLRAMAKAWPA